MALVPLALRRDPLDVFAGIADEPGGFLLDVPDPARPVTLLGCHPVDEFRVPDDAADPLGDVARFVAASPRPPAAVPTPLAGGLIGYLAYEAGRTVAPRARRHASPVPLALLRRYDPMLVYDHRRRRYFVLTSDRTPRAGWLERLQQATRMPIDPPAGTRLEAALTPDEHRAGVLRILEYLAAGDIYQANLTQPFTAPLTGPAWTLFVRLTRAHPAAHASYLDAGDFQIVGNSPELLLRRRGGLVETRPIKGTRPRGGDPVADAQLAAELALDAKERAEHVMIVDLERNDLGRVCQPGSVRVEDFARVTSLPSVHHLVSTVRGRLAQDVDLQTLLAATFPGGSITGAPKVRAMEIIAEIETEARGVYTGALGLFDPRGDVELGLPIRTAVVRDGMLSYHAGGGIVADSDPDRELAECWTKTAALRRALGAPIVPTLDECSSG